MHKVKHSLTSAPATVVRYFVTLQPIMAGKCDTDCGLAGWANVDFADIELGERIGGGGVGIIYKGWFKDQPVALKTLFDARIGADLKQEYMDELLVMSKVEHSNIVKFLGACMKPPNLCFIMELCDTSLFNLLHVDRVRLTMRDNLQVLVRNIFRGYSGL
jgi:hypothetical protein